MDDYVDLYCEGCDSFFECEPELAAQHLRLADDPDFMTPILCNSCTLQAMIDEECENETSRL